MSIFGQHSETEVLHMVARGRSNRQIAGRLVIREATMHTRVSNILAKLHLHSRTQAAVYALREGLACTTPVQQSRRQDSLRDLLVIPTYRVEKDHLGAILFAYRESTPDR